MPVDRELFGRRTPLLQFVFELGQARFELAARFAAMANFRFQPGNFGIGRIHVALRVVQGIAGSEMGFAGFLGTRLGFTQCGILRFEIGHRALDFERQALPLSLGFALFQEPEYLLAQHQLLVQALITTCHFGLDFQPLHLVTEFKADVFNAQQVFAGVLQTAVRFLAPLLVAGNPGRFFEEDTQIIRPCLDDARNHALTDDGVGAWSEASAQKQVGDVLAADLQIVDEVIRLPLPRQRALDRQLGVLRPLAERPAEQILENQFH